MDRKCFFLRQVIQKSVENISGDEERQLTAKLILGAILLKRLEDPRASADFFAYRPLYRMDVNIDISRRIVNCQLYQI